MSEAIPWLELGSLSFPPPENALHDPNGLLAIGGDLSPQRLLSAYSAGIFPWFSEADPILWWSPNPRAIIPIAHLNINRTLRKFIKKCPYTVTVNRAFEEVINFCADAPFRDDETWIVEEMKQGYINLHQQGDSHSIEVWQEDELVGGLYGVAIGGYFSGESMFYTKSNASKVALVALAQLLNAQNVAFIDCQLLNPFLADMGCIEVSRAAFLQQQSIEKQRKVTKDFWQPRTISLSIL
ncbi:leucyl/phenylalanyl-tRNA--protein transferase [Thalassotalea hakodatensis]|uniref:leucyl/phenylalanyl-tRNA--protein transferase n=1 Tax=Thalassotalea hakodatensis TaxID=3030492 RepID=UPI002572FC69|nr:leucyl/phenylalanyl-tRNA--protein transferase [Thalassotalea hakodatensis]